MTSMFEFCHELHIDVRNFVEGKIDFGALELQYFGHAATLPERYNVAPFSRRRTSQRFVSFLDQFASV